MNAIAIVGVIASSVMIAHGLWVLAYAHSPLYAIRERLKAYGNRTQP